eukprot:8964888-Pyramimonas_sp.AAC.1
MVCTVYSLGCTAWCLRAGEVCAANRWYHRVAVLVLLVCDLYSGRGQFTSGGVNSPTEGVNSPAEGVNSPAEGVNSRAGSGDTLRGRMSIAYAPKNKRISY